MKREKIIGNGVDGWRDERDTLRGKFHVSRTGKKVSILPCAAQSNSSLAPSVKLLYLLECNMVTLNLLLIKFASSFAKRAAAPGIGDAAPTATCLSLINKSDN